MTAQKATHKSTKRTLRFRWDRVPWVPLLGSVVPLGSVFPLGSIVPLGSVVPLGPVIPLGSVGLRWGASGSVGYSLFR